jgi:hypothetical protein
MAYDAEPVMIAISDSATRICPLLEPSICFDAVEVVLQLGWGSATHYRQTHLLPQKHAAMQVGFPRKAVAEFIVA